MHLEELDNLEEQECSTSISKVDKLKKLLKLGGSSDSVSVESSNQSAKNNVDSIANEKNSSHEVTPIKSRVTNALNSIKPANGLYVNPPLFH